jgi:hypothetical protein
MRACDWPVIAAATHSTVCCPTVATASDAPHASAPSSAPTSPPISPPIAAPITAHVTTVIAAVAASAVPGAAAVAPRIAEGAARIARASTSALAAPMQVRVSASWHARQSPAVYLRQAAARA